MCWQDPRCFSSCSLADICVRLQARTIAESRVSLPSAPGEPAHVESSTAGTVWIVYKPTTDWACCTCNDGQRGNICSHQLKVISMLQQTSEAELVRRLGTFKGHANGGLPNLGAAQAPPPSSIDDEQFQLTSPVQIDADTGCEIAPQDIQVVDDLENSCSLVQHEHEAAAQEPAQPSCRIDRESLRLKLDTILDAAADDPECLEIMNAGLSGLLGRVKNAQAYQKGSLPHPMAAASLEALPGSNSLLRWKPFCETGSSKTSRKRQSAYAALLEPGDEEKPAEPLPMPIGASKKKSFRQQISAGVLAEQATNLTAPASRPPGPSTLRKASSTAAPAAKENSPPKQASRAPTTASLAQLFRRKN